MMACVNYSTSVSFAFLRNFDNFAKLIENDITRYNEKEISCI